MKEPFARIAGLITCTLMFISACQQNKPSVVDMAPLPSTPIPPYVCDYIPRAAATLMTGISEPTVVGFLKGPQGEPGYGTCGLYQPSAERVRLLRVILDTGGTRGQVDEYLKDGGKLLPEIVPGGYGAYVKDPDKGPRVGAILVKGKARLLIELARGAEGRDHSADMIALMKLIAPRLLNGTDAPSPSMSRKKGA
jgi:hypothetical protein